MKAYEFYVLLGKYKRKSLTRSEYDRFCNAIATVRGYRSTFHESTGESYPVFSQHATARARLARSDSTVANTSHKQSKPSHLQSKPTPQSTAASIPPPHQRAERDVIEQHRTFKRVRRKHRRRFRTIRLLRDFLWHHPALLLFLAIIASILILALVLQNQDSLPATHTPPSPKQPDTLPESPDSSSSMLLTPQTEVMPSQTDSGFSQSPNPIQWESDPLAPMQVPVTGLEQAILEGLEARFPEPTSLLNPSTPSAPEPIQVDPNAKEMNSDAATDSAS